MDTPIVSILMPAYNVERYIGESIDSILNQTFTDFELIIVNDGSTDKTKNVILSYKDERIKYYEQENMGVARTLNNGLKFCTGKYVRRHDADDLSTPNSLEEQVKFLEQHPEIGLISSRQVYMTANNKKCKKYGLPNDAFFDGEIFKFISLDNFTYKASSPIVHGTVLFDKELVAKLGNYRPAFLTSEDNDLWTRILEHKKIVVLNSQTYFQRIHATSATRKYGNTLRFYREKVRDFAVERQQTGSDLLMRSEPMPIPPEEDNSVQLETEKALAAKKKLFRADILDFQYKIFVDAKDWELIWASVKIALKYGWKLKRTWKAILFPLLGERFIKFGVKVKSIFKS